MAALYAQLATPSFALLTSIVAAQSFVVDSSVTPGSPPFQRSEEVELADVDLDGDLDAFFAEGGEMSGDPEELWINQGGLQGGTLGVFLDESAARVPIFNDPSLDIDLVDIDSDGDLDTHTTNTDLGWFKVTARWGVNVGGLQGGALGYFVDETAQRWVGLAGPGSSITPFQLVAGGGWTDASYTAAFADLDNDGDLDLAHSTYRSSQPPRLFLNDGLGFFAEFNPAGTVTASGYIAEGSTALWCEGLQQEDTADVSGSFCDVLMLATDLDLADVDGDLDVDIAPSDWVGNQQRLFANRLEGSALAPKTSTGLLFRDVTALGMPLIATAISPVCAELGDLDGDGDVDLYGGNWDASGGLLADDAAFENTGTGFFSAGMPVASSVPNDNDVVYLDFDADGDLDIAVAAVNGNRLYRNDGAFQLALEPSAGAAWNNLDAAGGDTDGDGDTDLLFARAGKDEFQRNITKTPIMSRRGSPCWRV